VGQVRQAGMTVASHRYQQLHGSGTPADYSTGDEVVWTDDT